MDSIKRNNLKFAMREAHKVAGYMKEKYPAVDYIEHLRTALKSTMNMMKKKAVSAPKYNYMGGKITAAQLATIRCMRNVLGSKWDGTRGKSVAVMTQAQARVEINRNMSAYEAEKEMGFCPVDVWQQILSVYAKNGVECKLIRRKVSEPKARKWLASIV